MFGLTDLFKKLNLGKGFSIVIVLLLLGLGFMFARNIFTTVSAGTYQVKQAAFTGTLTAKMTPGIHWIMFGDYFTFPNSETFFFTKDHSEGKKADESIEVTFADGSRCKISGTARIILPTTEDEAKYLTDKLGFRSYEALENKLILPTVRRALVLTANMMTAQESYSTKRADFLKIASDQIEHGIAATDEIQKEIKDPITGENVMKTFKVIRKDKNGVIMYESNPLEGTGIKLKNFEVKDFDYDGPVKAQISKQQEALMGVATAKADAARAEAEKITAEAKGLSAVMTAKYEKEKEKVQAVVKAEQDKAVAVTAAQQEKETAILKKEAAEFTKQKDILLGEGQARQRELLLNADGALAVKVEAYKFGVETLAKAWASRQVPSYYIDGGGNSSGNVSDASSVQFMNMINTQLAKNLGLDLHMDKQPAKK